MALPTTHTTTNPVTGGGGYPDTADRDGYGGKHGRHGLFRHDDQPGMPDHRGRRIANPAPLGMFSLAATTLMWSLFNARTRDIFEVNGVIGMALAVGGLCQLLAGMWEFAHGHTFGATTFTLLGGFWISYGIMYWPTSGALSSYSSTGNLGSALGIYFMVWMVVAFMLFLATFRGSIPLAGTFFLLFLTYILIGAAHFTGRVGVLRAGGIIGCLASVLAFYTGAIGLHNRDTTYYDTPPLGLGKRRDATTADTRY